MINLDFWAEYKSCKGNKLDYIRGIGGELYFRENENCNYILFYLFHGTGLAE